MLLYSTRMSWGYTRIFFNAQYLIKIDLRWISLTVFWTVSFRDDVSGCWKILWHTSDLSFIIELLHLTSALGTWSSLCLTMRYQLSDVSGIAWLVASNDVLESTKQRLHSLAIKWTMILDYQNLYIHILHSILFETHAITFLLYTSRIISHHLFIFTLLSRCNEWYCSACEYQNSFSLKLNISIVGDDDIVCLPCDYREDSRMTTRCLHPHLVPFRV